uniref:Uncharacterized protein n=1 Tax=Anguilla anguilla TaxID=7936 RepID=A0A0E9PRR5_ANGAN
MNTKVLINRCGCHDVLRELLVFVCEEKLNTETAFFVHICRVCVT